MLTCKFNLVPALPHYTMCNRPPMICRYVMEASLQLLRTAVKVLARWWQKPSSPWSLFWATRRRYLTLFLQIIRLLFVFGVAWASKRLVESLKLAGKWACTLTLWMRPSTYSPPLYVQIEEQPRWVGGCSHLLQGFYEEGLYSMSWLEQVIWNGVYSVQLKIPFKLFLWRSHLSSPHLNCLFTIPNHAIPFPFYQATSSHIGHTQFCLEPFYCSILHLLIAL